MAEKLPLLVKLKNFQRCCDNFIIGRDIEITSAQGVGMKLFGLQGIYLNAVDVEDARSSVHCITKERFGQKLHGSESSCLYPA